MQVTNGSPFDLNAASQKPLNSGLADTVVASSAPGRRYMRPTRSRSATDRPDVRLVQITPCGQSSSPLHGSPSAATAQAALAELVRISKEREPARHIRVELRPIRWSARGRSRDPWPETFLPVEGGQSRLWPPPPGNGNDRFTASTSQGLPGVRPNTHVPSRTPSPTTVSKLPHTPSPPRSSQSEIEDNRRRRHWPRARRSFRRRSDTGPSSARRDRRLDLKIGRDLARAQVDVGRSGDVVGEAVEHTGGYVRRGQRQRRAEVAVAQLPTHWLLMQLGVDRPAWQNSPDGHSAIQSRKRSRRYRCSACSRRRQLQVTPGERAVARIELERVAAGVPDVVAATAAAVGRHEAGNRARYRTARPRSDRTDRGSSGIRPS